MAGVPKTEPHLVKNKEMCTCESEQKDVHVSTVSTSMTKTVQQQTAHETLPLAHVLEQCKELQFFMHFLLQNIMVR